MAVFYKLYQSQQKNSAYKGQWYARAAIIGETTIDDLADILVNNYEIDENTPLPREVALKDAQELVDEWLKAGIMTK